MLHHWFYCRICCKLFSVKFYPERDIFNRHFGVTVALLNVSKLSNINFRLRVCWVSLGAKIHSLREVRKRQFGARNGKPLTRRLSSEPPTKLWTPEIFTKMTFNSKISSFLFVQIIRRESNPAELWFCRKQYIIVYMNKLELSASY